MASERALLGNSVQKNHQLSTVPRDSYPAEETKLRRIELMENYEDMDCPIGSLSGTSPVGSLELPKELLQALTGNRPQEYVTNITDLPGVVVGAILSRISNPIDVASAFMASRAFWVVAQAAPFRLELRPSRYEDAFSLAGALVGCQCPGFLRSAWHPFSVAGEPVGCQYSGLHHCVCNAKLGYDGLKVATWTRIALSGIRRTMVSTQELDLAGCPILDDDVAALLVDLSGLEHLVLDGCQKLTSSVADALAVSVRSGPRAVSLQRCFRLGPGAAGNLLTAAGAGGSRLQTLLLSHLDRLDLPQDPPVLESLEDGTEKGSSEYVELVKSIVSRVPGTGLRVLALHNCGGLGASELAAVAETCPYLEIWMLGGSTQGLGLSRSDVVPPEGVDIASSALIRATKLLSQLRILEVTFFSTPVLKATRAQMPSGIRVWDFCEKKSVMEAASMVAHLKGCSMPSYGEEYPVVSAEDVPFPDCYIDPLSEELELSNITQLESRQGYSGYFYTDKKWDSSTNDVLLAFKAGANCSDFRRRTPLHIAASRGDADVVAKLLFIGASATKMKDSGGATALFQAAESGHAEVCELLLKAGADVLSSNRTAETPLYISALRGHSAAVEVMLAHCHQQGINWQDAHVYGDGWTPLMAATLADRQAVAEVLLDFASASCPAPVEAERSRLELPCKPEEVLTAEIAQSSMETSSVQIRINSQSIGSRRISAPPLVDAQNRYGQTALHIAARKAYSWFVDYLLHAGASLDVKDEYNFRPIDLARKLQHSTIEETLKTWQEMRAKVSRASANGGSSPKRKSKQKKRAAAAAAAAAAEEQSKASTEPQASASDDEKMKSGGITLKDMILMLPGE